jgi:transcriptional regulator with XRE-family HTH domain
MTQADIEKRTGLLRCYISRVENGYTVPSLETLEKMSRACQPTSEAGKVDFESGLNSRFSD